MNLLTAPWIPIRDASTPEISLETLLCTDNSDLALGFHRDDLELAALQLAICLTQVLFAPADKRAWRERMRAPLTREAYQEGIQPFREWFDLRHATYPFMQTRGVQAKDFTPIQKLFAGLPEGNNHALFNDAGEIHAVPAAWAALALFNQAVNCPSFGGGFKGGLRGEAPVTTLIKGKTLRETVWRNVLHRDLLREKLPHLADISDEQDRPTWVAPIPANGKLYHYQIGILRGLFWQPAKVELLWNADGKCIGFNKEKFNYTVEGFWQHPHSPFIINLKQKKQFYVSFRNTAPAWTYCNQFLLEKETDKEGHVPALTITQYRGLHETGRLDLIAGGYKNKQASIIQRRHELVSLAHGWDENDENMANLEELIGFALKIKNCLTWALREFAKHANVPKLKLDEIAEQRFYLDSEDFIHRRLRHIAWDEIAAEKQRFFAFLSPLAQNVFEEVTRPYRNPSEPKMLQAWAEKERLLRRALRKLASTQEETPTP